MKYPVIIIIVIFSYSISSFSAKGQKNDNYYTLVFPKEKIKYCQDLKDFGGCALILRRTSILPKYFTLEITPLDKNGNVIDINNPHFFLKRFDKDKMKSLNSYVRAVYILRKESMDSIHMTGDADFYVKPEQDGQFIKFTITSDLKKMNDRTNSTTLNPSPPGGISTLNKGGTK